MCHFVQSPIALIRPDRYARRHNYSQQSIHLEKENNVKIQHTETIQGGKRIQYMDTHGRKRHYMLDGYCVDKEGREHSLEFNRCWYHGCTQCFPSDRDNICIQGKSLSQRFAEKRTLEELGYIVHETWACEFSKFERMAPDNVAAITPLNIRDAYTAVALMP